MKKKKMKPVTVPKFFSEAEEAAWWDRHRSKIEADIRERMKKSVNLGDLLQGGRASKPVTLRISQDDLAAARRLAAQRGLGYQTYMKMLLKNALGEDSAEGVVNELGTYAEVETGFRYWANAEFLTHATQSAIKKSDIVLVPEQGFADYVGPLFPKGSDDLFQYLRAHAPAKFNVELAAEDADYKELALHGDALNIATLLVTSVAAPIAVGLIVEYLKTRLGSHPVKTEVRVSIILDQSDGLNGKILRLRYEGPANALEKTMHETLLSIPRPQAPSPTILRRKTVMHHR